MKFRIASPCHARWEDMSGDERNRFCGQCEKHVYNFSRMSSEEISKLVTEKNENLCARFYQRADGTVLLENCPVGVERAFIALFVFSAGAWFVTARPRSGNAAYSRVASMWDEAVGTVKGWMGIQPPPMLMGEVCITPTPVVVPNQNSSRK